MKKGFLSRHKHVVITTLVTTTVALSAVGFSAWVIMDSVTTQDINNITVNVANTIDNSLRIELGGANNSGVLENNIRFDALYNDFEGPIQGDGNENNNEDLDFSIAFDVIVKNPRTFKGISILLNNRVDNHLSTWQTAGYIKMPLQNGIFSKLVDYRWINSNQVGTQTYYLNYDINSLPSIVTSESNANCELKITHIGGQSAYNITARFMFSWGEKFEFMNPCLSTNSKEATTALKAFADKRNQTSNFNLTLKHDPNAIVTI